MTTIDSYDLEHYLDYAKDIRDLENTYRAYKVGSLQEAGQVPPHTWVETLENTVPLLDLLTGVYAPEQKTIAFFTRPYTDQRYSPFGYFLLGPQLGSHEEQAMDLERLESFVFPQEEDSDKEQEDEKEGSEAKRGLEKRRKSAIEKMYQTLLEMNSWLLEIKGRQSQFQKG